MTHWTLRFPTSQIEFWASRYESEEESTAFEISSRVHQRGYYSYKDFLDLCRWKTPRSKSKCKRNDRKEVKEITQLALETHIEKVRIGILPCLHGVGWPTASVLLHFGHKDPYPILDVRALWSLGFSKRPPYTFDFWWRYVQTCRTFAKDAGVSMRTLDKALWQFSKEHQK